MGIELPEELAEVAAATGLSWPQADEDELHAQAAAWRGAQNELTALAAEADRTASAAAGALTGPAADAARGMWAEFVDPDRGHLTLAAKGAGEAADRLAHAAEQVATAKVEMVRQLVDAAKNQDAASAAAEAGHPTALLGLAPILKGTAANLALLTSGLETTLGPGGGPGSPDGGLLGGGGSGSPDGGLLGGLLAGGSDSPGSGDGGGGLLGGGLLGGGGGSGSPGSGGAGEGLLGGGLLGGGSGSPGSGDAGGGLLGGGGGSGSPGSGDAGGGLLGGGLLGGAVDAVTGAVLPGEPGSAAGGGGLASMVSAAGGLLDVNPGARTPEGQGDLLSAVTGLPGHVLSAVDSPLPEAPLLRPVDDHPVPVVPDPVADHPASPVGPGGDPLEPGTGPIRTGHYGGFLAPGGFDDVPTPPAGIPGGTVAAGFAPASSPDLHTAPTPRPAVPNVAGQIGTASPAPVQSYFPDASPHGPGQPVARPAQSPPGELSVARPGQSTPGAPVARPPQPQPGSRATPDGRPAQPSPGPRPATDGRSPQPLPGSGPRPLPPGSGADGHPDGRPPQPAPSQPGSGPRPVPDSRPPQSAPGSGWDHSGQPPLGAPRQERESIVALFRVAMFPIGHLPVATVRPHRQLAPPPPEVDYAAGLRFPPYDHPRSDLIVATTPRRRESSPKAPAPAGLFEHHDPLGGLNERDWDRRFLAGYREDIPEYAWPPGELYPEGGLEPGEPEVLPEGTLLDRFGPVEGRVFAPAGTLFAKRSLPPTATAEYRRYRVTRPVPMWQAVSAPWFGQPGGGLRYRAVHSADELVTLGYLEEEEEEE